MPAVPGLEDAADVKEEFRTAPQSRCESASFDDARREHRQDERIRREERYCGHGAL